MNTNIKIFNIIYIRCHTNKKGNAGKSVEYTQIVYATNEGSALRKFWNKHNSSNDRSDISIKKVKEISEYSRNTLKKYARNTLEK